MISFLVFVIFLAGFISAFIALDSFSKEAKILTRLERELERKFVEEVLEDPRLPANELLGADRRFLKGLVGRRVSAAYQAHRHRCRVRLPDLQALSATYESGLLSIKLARGVAGVLLIVGIAGTLLAIKPLLGRFTLIPDDAASLASAPAVVENSQELIRNLGSAFHPSLWALGGTVVMVAVLGLCHQKAGEVARDLDQFSVEYLLPYYRMTELGDDLNSVGNQFRNLVQTFQSTDAQIKEAISEVTNLADALNPAVEEMKKAATDFAKQTDALAKLLGKRLGNESPLVKKLDQLVSATQSASASLETSKSAAEQLSKDLQTASKELNQLPDKMETKLEAAQEVLVTTVNQAAESLKRSVQPVADKLNGIHKKVDETAKQAQEAVNSVLEEALKKLQETPPSLAELGLIVYQLKQTTVHLDSVQMSLSQTSNKLAGLTDATAKKMEEVLQNAVAMVANKGLEVLAAVSKLVNVKDGSMKRKLASWLAWLKGKFIKTR